MEKYLQVGDAFLYVDTSAKCFIHDFSQYLLGPVYQAGCFWDHRSIFGVVSILQELITQWRDQNISNKRILK